jgi:hypothetical protein
MRLIRAGTQRALPTTITAEWAATGGGTMTTGTCPLPAGETGTRIRITTSGGQPARFRHIPPAAITWPVTDATVTIVVFVETPNEPPAPSKNGCYNGAVILANDAGFVNMFQANVKFKPGMNTIILTQRDFAAAGGSPTWTNFLRFQIGIDAITGVPITAYLVEVRSGEWGRAIVCPFFDDAEDTVRTAAKPILDALQIPMTIGIISGKVGTTEGPRIFSTLAQLHAMRDSAVPPSFCPHTADHLQDVLNDPQTPRSTIIVQYLRCTRYIIDNGLDADNSAWHAIAPYGEIARRIVETLQNLPTYIGEIATVDPGLYRWYMDRGGQDRYLSYRGTMILNSTRPADACDSADLRGGLFPYPCFNVDRAFTVATVMSFWNGCITAQRLFAPLYHDVRNTAVADIDRSLANYTSEWRLIGARRPEFDALTWPQLYRLLAPSG